MRRVKWGLRRIRYRRITGAGDFFCEIASQADPTERSSAAGPASQEGQMADWLHGVSVGDWFQAGESEPFEIVAVDIENEVVLVQHYDATLEEYDFDSWMELGARPAAPPEDWSGAMDVEKSEVRGNDLASSERWEDPLDLLDQRFS